MSTTTLYDGDTFEHAGLKFRFRTERDDDMPAPWQAHDGHGPVSEWTSRAKRPGEMAIARDRGGLHMFYDVAEATRIGHRDGWSVHPSLIAPGATRGEIVALAVARDMEYMRAWCADEWQWIGVIVERIDSVGRVIASEAIWGIESSEADYLRQTAHELADEIARAAARAEADADAMMAGL